MWSDLKVLSLKNLVNLIRLTLSSMTLSTKRISADNSVLGKLKMFLNVGCGCKWGYACFPFSMIIRTHNKQYCRVEAVLCD